MRSSDRYKQEEANGLEVNDDEGKESKGRGRSGGRGITRRFVIIYNPTIKY
jgi:hypothetical protein